MRNIGKSGAAIMIAGTFAWHAEAFAAGSSADKASAGTVVASTNPTGDGPKVQPRYYVAVDEPRRLTDLAGNDDRAWASARNVHPRLTQRRAPR